MNFWEIMFNVVAVLWSPIAITVYGFIFGLILFSIMVTPYGMSTGEVVALVIAWVAVSVLVWTFPIWWVTNGYQPMGWHYPVEIFSSP